jgi:hypothetical protein
MKDWKLPLTGGCRCDRVRFRVTATPLLASACHCSGCQRMTGSAYSLTLTLPTQGFEVTQGEPVIGGLHGPVKHLFCDHCKSWMFTRPDVIDSFVNVRATMLDDRSWFVPFVETWTSEKLPWAATGAVHSFETQPSFDLYAKLAEDFAANGARAT